MTVSFDWSARFDLPAARLPVGKDGDVEAADVRIDEWHHIVSEDVSRVRPAAVHVIVGCCVLALTLAIVPHSDGRAVCADGGTGVHVGRVGSHSHYDADALIGRGGG